MPESPDVLAKCLAHLKERDWRNVRPFPGIHAERAGLQTEHVYEVDHPGSKFRMGYKPTGIWLSHYMLWNALSLLHDDYFCVFETDVKLPEDCHTRVINALNDCPQDFDVLYIGSCCCQGRPQSHVKGEVFEVRYPLCTHAIIWARKALPTLIQTLRRCWAPIDIQLAFEVLPHLKAYAVLPRIIEQHDTIIPPLIMNATENIASLLKQGCKAITFTLSPKGNPVIVAEQIVVTGPDANFTRIAHQFEGNDFATCLNQLAQNVQHVGELKTMIVLPMKRN